jgi:sulfur carrier protein
MNVILNGKSHTLGATATVADLLASIGFADRPVVVEVNKEALLPREHATRQLGNGDVIEVVQITAGG